MERKINYTRLNSICHTRGIRSTWLSPLTLTAHNAFLKQYPKIFMHEKPILPKITQDEKRKFLGKTEVKQAQPDESHDIAVYIKKARGRPSLNKEENDEKNFMEFLAIVRKMPTHRTAHEHSIVFKTLKKIPEVASQLSSKHLKILSKKIFSQIWIKDSLVIGDDGLYIILKGRARPRVKELRSLCNNNGSVVAAIPKEGTAFDAELKTSTMAELYLPSQELKLEKWSTFGSLKFIPKAEMDGTLHSVVTEDDCEILKIPTKEYEKLKSEKERQENLLKLKLIHKCPFYEHWPILYICDLVSLSKRMHFPPGQVLVESGTVISFVGFIISGYCNIYRNVVGLMDLQANKVQKVKKLVYMGRLQAKESFGEISILLQDPFSCTVITGEEVDMAIIEDKDILELDPVIKELMIQTAKPTFGHLTDDDVKHEYIQRVQQKEWKTFKSKTIEKTLFYNGVVPALENGNTPG